MRFVGSFRLGVLESAAAVAERRRGAADRQPGSPRARPHDRGQTDYSVYTMRQASRRSWRIGQTEPAQIVFLAYRNTL